MALSDVLQFHYSMDNEVARNATKDFAGLLGKAFEQYQKLWNQYLKLRKHCEDAAFDIPFQLLESENCGKDNRKLDKSQASTDNTNKSTSTYESICTTCSSDVSMDLDDTVFNHKNPIQKQKEEELLRSPILIKKRSKSRRTSVTNDSILESFQQNVMKPSVPIKQNISILTDSFKENKVPVEPKEMKVENNNDQIECTPTAIMPKKLGVSKLYNVDTTLLQDGKKLRQSKIVLLPGKQSADTPTNTRCKKSSPLKSHVSPTPEKNVNEKSRREKRYAEEDIIEGSPNKRTKSSLKIKSLKLKRKSPIKHNRMKNNIFDASNDESSNINLAVKEKNQSSLSQFLLPVHTSTQKDQQISVTRSKTFDFCDENVECDILSSPFSPITLNVQNPRFNDTGGLTSLNDTEAVRTKENINQAEEKKYSEVDSETLGNDSSICNDETFYCLGENLKKKSTCGASQVNSIKENTSENRMLSAYQSVKKSLMNSFDIPPEKKEINDDKPLKKKSERAKMAGVSCWECKKYYGNLGLSEDEIKARQNQCSRHRTKYSEREGTPEGFWDPVFPDTFSSTFQDN